ncbi:hypothetical protein [Pukyongiella litopenaei]|uniref:Uncharacterized protein n=1 Tax=Pukyongiella litopenaei TaxID=2605946 RepID=A0A5C2H692_9RHOB|nr:hypothetical protein [Pukyongiella litopenaei]QEP30472.1 hypothetical protein C6Y53_19910 [Pukyongiella litopenaei]
MSIDHEDDLDGLKEISRFRGRDKNGSLMAAMSSGMAIRPFGVMVLLWLPPLLQDVVRDT